MYNPVTITLFLIIAYNYCKVNKRHELMHHFSSALSQLLDENPESNDCAVK